MSCDVSYEKDIKEQPEEKDKIDINDTPVLKENIVRNLCGRILGYALGKGCTNQYLGLTYYYAHCLFMGLITFIFCFSNNLNSLCVLLIMISIDFASIVILHGCPITLLEQKYLNTNSIEVRSSILKDCNIVYKCDHTYEQQLDVLVNVWFIVAFKCLTIIWLRLFNLKLSNDYRIYV